MFAMKVSHVLCPIQGIHLANRHHLVDPSNGQASQATFHKLCVKFPRGRTTLDIQAATGFALERFSVEPGKESRYCLVTAALDVGTAVTVDGFGVPFYNSEDEELGAWLNDDQIIKGGFTLLNFLRERKFYFLVSATAQGFEREFSEARLPPPFAYPYGDNHDWDSERLWNTIQNNKSDASFSPAYR